jgi:hypothetical protein
MLARRIIGKPKPKASMTLLTTVSVVRRVIGKPKHSSNLTTLAPVPQAKRVIGKPKLAVPPIPAPGTYITKTMESFEALREYYTQRSEVIPQSVIKWYHEELVAEKKEMDEFWSRCAATKACIEGTLRGDDTWTINLAINAARQAEKKLPILETDIGPMPAYGTGEFWAWCSKRKKLKTQKEEAMIAAGIPVPPAKVKKPRKKVEPKAVPKADLGSEKKQKV